MADAATVAALNSVNQLYRDLGTQRFQDARRWLTPGFARAFAPESYRRYQAISISELRSAGREGRTVILRGIVSLDQLDGGRLIETRKFWVDTASRPARISGSKLISPGSDGDARERTSRKPAGSTGPSAHASRDGAAGVKPQPRKPEADTKGRAYPAE